MTHTFIYTPAVFFNVTPCDEYNSRIILYVTSKEHKLSSLNDIENQAYCLIGLNTRYNLQAKYPGARARAL